MLAAAIRIVIVQLAWLLPSLRAYFGGDTSLLALWLTSLVCDGS